MAHQQRREAVYGGGTTCPDGEFHQTGCDPDRCWRCLALLKPQLEPSKMEIECSVAFCLECNCEIPEGQFYCAPCEQYLDRQGLFEE